MKLFCIWLFFIIAVICVCPSSQADKKDKKGKKGDKGCCKKFPEMEETTQGLKEEITDLNKRQESMEKSFVEQLTQLLGNVNALQSIVNPDIETDGWELVFRATAGNGYSVYDAWTTGKDTTDVKPSSMARQNSRHYRKASKIHDWANVERVKYAMYENGREVANIIFDGTGSNNVNWFDSKRVLASSWPAVNAKGEFNYFSIAGHLGLRRFFVNLRYNGCNGDVGYTVVSDVSTAKRPCWWDVHPFYPQFLYAKMSTADRWNRMTFGLADYMAVYVKSKSEVLQR